MNEGESIGHSGVSDSLRPRGLYCQAPLALEFSWQEEWSGLPFLSPGDLPDLGIQPGSPALQAESLPCEPAGEPSMNELTVLEISHPCGRRKSTMALKTSAPSWRM